MFQAPVIFPNRANKKNKTNILIQLNVVYKLSMFKFEKYELQLWPRWVTVSWTSSIFILYKYCLDSERYILIILNLLFLQMVQWKDFYFVSLKYFQT